MIIVQEVILNLEVTWCASVSRNNVWWRQRMWVLGGGSACGCLVEAAHVGAWWRQRMWVQNKTFPPSRNVVVLSDCVLMVRLLFDTKCCPMKP